MFAGSTLYWLESILFERFGVILVCTLSQGKLYLSLHDTNKYICFDHLQLVFHQSRSDFSCFEWNSMSEGYQTPIAEQLPAPSESQLPSQIIEYHQEGATIHYDILGLTYWMLTRLEEVGRNDDLDKHRRFPATASHAYRHGYLERPLVDEWLDILGQVIQRVWPSIQLKQHVSSIKVSHDVDTPSLYGFSPWPTILRMMAGHILKRRDFKGFFTAPYVKLATRNQLHPADPFNTFEWLMDVSESRDLKSAFYFICGGSHPKYDPDYEISHPTIRNLMGRIHERGHEIGLHPSYSTFQHAELIKKEAECLKTQCAEEGIIQEKWGGRMHYLRWEQATTLLAWELAGMDYDSTLGYADSPGFRCGTCHEYPAFDPVNQQMLKLRIRPLIVMEATIIDDLYLGLGVSDLAMEKVSILKKYCKQVGGQFTLLWHNSYFYSEKHMSMYQKCIES